MRETNIAKLVERKLGRPPRTRVDEELNTVREFLSHPDIADYLRRYLPHEVLGASGVRVLPFSDIEQEMTTLAPGVFVRPYGYLVIATSVGGNAICLHNPSGRVFWADHDSFCADSISYKDRASGEWKYLYQYSAANVEKAMVLLADEIPSFLEDLFSDRLSDKLDELD